MCTKMLSDVFACADPTQVVSGYIASMTSPPDARYSPLRPPLKRGPRTYPMVRALVLPLLDAPEIQQVRTRAWISGPFEP